MGDVPAIEMVTVGQRRGLGLPGGGPKRFVLSVDRESSTVVVGDESDLLDASLAVGSMTWGDDPVEGDVLVQVSAHGTPKPATASLLPDGRVHVAWVEPQRRVAIGQSVVLYDLTDTDVLGGGLNTAP